MNSNPKSIIVVNGVLQSAEELKLKNGFKNYSLKKKFSNEENIQINKNNSKIFKFFILNIFLIFFFNKSVLNIQFKKIITKNFGEFICKMRFLLLS